MKNSPRLSRHILPAVSLAAIAAVLSVSLVKAQMGGPSGAFNTPDPFATQQAPEDTPTPKPRAATTPPPATVPSAPAAITPAPNDGTTIVNANQTVQATKRGVCENHLSSEDFVALSKGVSWYYNWAANTSDTPPGNAHMEFIPMAWGRGGDAGALAGYLGGHRPRAVLAINEPNLKGQAFLTPEATAALYRQIKQVADGYRIPVVGPNMALGSPPNASIKAKDPLTNQDMVYGWFGPFVQAFQYFAKKANAQPGSLGTHSYKDMTELKWAVSKSYELSGKPVWVTEFAFWDAKNDQDELQYLRSAVEFLENSSQVAGYAWFKERVSKNPKLSLLGDSGKLTPLGQEYVKLPSHSMHVFYRIPGLLDAGKYAANDNMTLQDTTDAAGDFDMVSTGPSWIDYNIQVDQPGTYLLKFRVSGATGKIDIVQNGQLLTSVDSTETGWHTVAASVSLQPGTQTVRICCNGQILHSIEFAMAE